MTMPFLLYTFRDRTTGEIRDIGAPDEAAARTSLGGVWTDRERAPSWTACEIGDLDKVLADAMKEERRALDAALELNPLHRKRRATTPETLAAFSQARERHRTAKARVRDLMRRMGAGQ
jgi:hypothetical protein